MRFVVMTALGFLVGCALVMVGLYFNPLTADSGEVVGVNARVLNYDSPFAEGIAVTHSGRTRLPLRPPTIPELWESTISSSMLSVIVLRDDDGSPVGVASRVSLFSEATEMLTRGVIVDDNWLVTIPDEGSFFVNADSNLWPFLKETLIPVWYLDRPWDGPRSYRPTAGPGIGGSAVVTGATGRFADRAGSAVETYQVAEFDKATGPGNIAARLFLNWSDTTTNLASE